MVYLTSQQILFVHYRLIEATGGSHGVRDLGALQAAAARSQATYDGNDLYPGLFTKAAALMESLIKNHPFVDGNKCTAITAAAIFLRQNGFLVDASQSEIYQFTMAMATGDARRDEAEAWLSKHSRQML